MGNQRKGQNNQWGNNRNNGFSTLNETSMGDEFMDAHEGSSEEVSHQNTASITIDDGKNGSEKKVVHITAPDRTKSLKGILFKYFQKALKRIILIIC